MSKQHALMHALRDGASWRSPHKYTHLSVCCTNLKCINVSNCCRVLEERAVCQHVSRQVAVWQCGSNSSQRQATHLLACCFLFLLLRQPDLCRLTGLPSVVQCTWNKSPLVACGISTHTHTRYRVNNLG